MRQRREYVARLMLAGLPQDQVIEQCTRVGQGPDAPVAIAGITENQVRYVFDSINEDWARQSEGELRYARAQAVQRVRRDLAQQRAPVPLRDRDGQVVQEVVRDEQGRPVKRGRRFLRRPVDAPRDWRSITAHEMLLARIEGTLRPLEVKPDPAATSRRALQAVISGLSAEDMDRLVAEQEELERKARGG